MLISPGCGVDINVFFLYNCGYMLLIAGCGLDIIVYRFFNSMTPVSQFLP